MLPRRFGMGVGHHDANRVVRGSGCPTAEGCSFNPPQSWGPELQSGCAGDATWEHRERARRLPDITLCASFGTSLSPPYVMWGGGKGHFRNSWAWGRLEQVAKTSGGSDQLCGWCTGNSGDDTLRPGTSDANSGWSVRTELYYTTWSQNTWPDNYTGSLFFPLYIRKNIYTL